MATFYDFDSIWRERLSYPNICDYEVTVKQSEDWSPSPRSVTPLPSNPSARPLNFMCTINVKSFQLPYPRIELFTTKTVIVESIDTNVLTSTAHGLAVNDIVQTSSTTAVGIQPNVQYHVINVTPNTFQLSLLSGGAAITLTNGTGLDLPLSLVTTDVDTALSNALQLLSLPRIYLAFSCNQYKDNRAINTIGGVLPDAKFILVQEKIHYASQNVPTWINYRCDMEQTMRFSLKDIVKIKITTRDGTVLPFFTESNREVPKNPMMQSLLTICVTPYIRDNDYSNHEVEPLTST